MPHLASIRILRDKIKWLLYERTSMLSDFILLILNIRPKGISVKSINGKKMIVYVGGFLSPRIPRIAKWSKRLEGFSTMLLCHRQGFFEKFTNPDIDYTILYRNKFHLKRIIKHMSSPYIMQGFAPKSKYPYIAMEYLRKYHPGVAFVSDYQDVLAIYYGINPPQAWLKRELPYEHKLMEQVDGIVAHSLEPCEGMKLWGIKEKKKRLFFPLYCDDDYFCVPKQPYASDNIHLVYAGGVHGSHRDKRYYSGTQLHWLIEYLSEQKVHFHIYPSPSVQKADYEEYEQIAKENSYFHFHHSVSQASLPLELSKYHYGIMPFFRETNSQSNLKLKYATTLKLYNYAEAGIPMLVGGGVFYQAWIVKRYKLGLVINNMDEFKDIRIRLEFQPYEMQVQNVLESREKLSLKNHMPRLLRFYQSVRNEK